MSLIERRQESCRCDEPDNPSAYGSAECPLHGWDALRRQVVRLSLQHQGAVERAEKAEKRVQELLAAHAARVTATEPKAREITFTDPAGGQ